MLVRSAHLPTPSPIGAPLRQPAGCQARGFSLMELMIVVVILAVIAAIAMPNFLIMMQNTRISITADSVRDAVMVARTETIRRGTTVTLSGAGTPPSWSTGWELRDADGVLLRERQFASGLTVGLVNAPAGADNIVFRPNGTINNTPTSEMYVLVQGEPGRTGTARAVLLNRGVSVCKQGDSNCPI